jgi:cathepsin D
VYNPSASSTSIDLGMTFSIEFGDGSTVSGEQFIDTVGIAGLTVSIYIYHIIIISHGPGFVQATTQTLGDASTYSSGFNIDQFPSDGLMGMAFPEISEFNAPPVFQTLVAEGQTTQPVFGVKLATNGSELFLGGVHTSLFSGAFTFINVTQEVCSSFPRSWPA